MQSGVTRTPGRGFVATLGGLVAGWPARRPSTPGRGSGRLRNTVAQCTVRCCRAPPLLNRITPLGGRTVRRSWPPAGKSRRSLGPALQGSRTQVAIGYRNPTAPHPSPCPTADGTLSIYLPRSHRDDEQR